MGSDPRTQNAGESGKATTGPDADWHPQTGKSRRVFMPAIGGALGRWDGALPLLGERWYDHGRAVLVPETGEDDALVVEDSPDHRDRFVRDDVRVSEKLSYLEGLAGGRPSPGVVDYAG